MRREVKIGVFAVVMLGCLWGGIRFLSGIDIFSRNIPYYVAYPEISGIQTATPVTIQGVKVGTVTAIGFDPSVSRDVVLQLTVRRSFRIPRDSKARIYSDGFMGGKAIAIEMGDSPQLLSKGDTLVAAETRDMLAAAGTGLADKCNGLSFGHHQIDVLQHFALAVVTEGEVLKFNPVIHPVQRQRVYRFLNGVLGFQYFVHTFHGCQTLWNVVSCLCKVFQRIDDTVQNHHIEDER